MVDRRSQILAARKPVQPQWLLEPPAAGGETMSIAPRSNSGTASIALESNSPFGIFDKKKRIRRGPARHAHTWAEDWLRSNAGRQVRVVLAVRDAARQAEKLGLDPTRDQIYVASSIREAWNLKPDQLSKGLSALETTGEIRVCRRTKGRHLRFTLAADARTTQ